ncbi:hypothetical protein BaRGS_00014579, partial [Batillaria attramentaria]
MKRSGSKRRLSCRYYPSISDRAPHGQNRAENSFCGPKLFHHFATKRWQIIDQSPSAKSKTYILPNEVNDTLRKLAPANLAVSLQDGRHPQDGRQKSMAANEIRPYGLQFKCPCTA